LSETICSIRTKLWWNSHWMVLFQNCVSGSHALPPRWPPQCSCVVIESSFDPGERLQAPGSLLFLLNIPKQLAKSIIYMSTLIWKKGKYIVKRTGRAWKWSLWPGDHYTKVTVRAGLTVFSIIEKIGCFKQEYPHMLFLWKIH
jgi:hypothetical protein